MRNTQIIAVALLLFAGGPAWGQSGRGPAVGHLSRARAGHREAIRRMLPASNVVLRLPGIRIGVGRRRSPGGGTYHYMAIRNPKSTWGAALEAFQSRRSPHASSLDFKTARVLNRGYHSIARRILRGRGERPAARSLKRLVDMGQRYTRGPR